MIAVRFHGRGGQGSVIASQLLATAFFLEGKDAQSFPKFGVERRGAPVTAFVRASDEKIYSRYQIYEPDYLVILDSSLINGTDVASGLKPDGLIIVNSPKNPEDFKSLNPFKVISVNASEIALKHRLGSETAPIVNTVILGAFAKITGLISIDALKRAIEQEGVPYPERNIAAAEEAYESAMMEV